jgi:polyhydroxybutyrate depolymerase
MRRSLLALLLTGALVTTACATDGPAAQSPGTTSTSTAAQATTDPSAGCQAAPGVTAGEEEVTTSFRGEQRWYIRQVPTGHGPEPMPLVLNFHGYSAGAQSQVALAGLTPITEREGFVVITPNGSGPVPRWDVTLDSTDVAFVGGLLDEVEDALCIDRNRVYATGMSNGAMMTSAVACAHAERIAAAAPVAGILDVAGCDPDQPVPFLAFHGTDDGYLAWNGGFGEQVASLPAPDGSGRTLGDLLAENAPAWPDVPGSAAAWARRNGCATPPTEEVMAADVVRMEYDCPPGAEAVLHRIDGGGHSWPGSTFSQAIERFVGVTSTSISASELIWEFFERHPRR